MKTSEEIPDAFEEIEKDVVACTNSNGGLVVIQQDFYHNDLDEKKKWKDTHCKKDIEANKNCPRWLEWNLMGEVSFKYEDKIRLRQI